MRSIEILDDLRLRFPQRSPEFDEGVEVGALAVLMALGERAITRAVSPAALQQLRAVAERLRYRVIEAPDGEVLLVTFERTDTRPSLRVVGNT